MKAICISDEWDVAKKLGHWYPVFGEEVIITNVFNDPLWGEYYELEKGVKNFGYDANKFVPADESEEIAETIQKKLVHA